MPVRYARALGPGPGSGTLADPWINSAQIQAGLSNGDELMWIGEFSSDGLPITWGPINLSQSNLVVESRHVVVVGNGSNVPFVSSGSNCHFNRFSQGHLTLIGIAASTSSPIFQIGGNGSSMSRVWVQSDATGTYGNGRWYGGLIVNDCVLENVVVVNSQSYGLAIGGSAVSVILRKCTVHDCAGGGNFGTGFYVSAGSSNDLFDCCATTCTTGFGLGTSRVRQFRRINTFNCATTISGTPSVAPPGGETTTLDPAYVNISQLNAHPTSAAILPGGANAGRASATNTTPGGFRNATRGADMVGVAPAELGLSIRYRVVNGSSLQSAVAATNGTWDAMYLGWVNGGGTMDLTGVVAGIDIGSNQTIRWLDVAGLRDWINGSGSNTVIDSNVAIGSELEQILVHSQTTTPFGVAPSAPADEFRIGGNINVSGVQFVRPRIVHVTTAP